MSSSPLSQDRPRSFDGFNMHSLENSLIDIMRAEQDTLKGKIRVYGSRLCVKVPYWWPKTFDPSVDRFMQQLACDLHGFYQVFVVVGCGGLTLKNGNKSNE